MIRDAKMPNKISFIGRLLGVALVFLGLWACGDRAETQDKPQFQPGDTVKRVKVSTVRALPPKGSVEYVGVLTAHRKVTVACEMGGTIERLYFERGDTVHKGQLLAEIGTSGIRLQVQQAVAAAAAARSNWEKMEKGSRPEEIEIAEAAFKEAQAALIESEKSFERANNLCKIRAMPDSELDSAKRALDMSRARMESAKQQLALARQGPRIEDRKAARANLAQAEATLAVAKDRLRKSMLHAPCDGIIAFREVEEGEVIVIPPAKIITQIVDLGRLKIKVSVGEKDIRVLHKQKRFPFTIDAIPGKTFSCQLSFLSPTASPVTRSFPVELMVEEPDPQMADGMTARIKFPLIDEKKTLKVPSAWLSEEDGKIGLYVVDRGKALFRRVTLGTYYDQRVEILSGLGDEEQVITNPAGIKSGDPVEY
jgi:multidrug efflux pump subunit AcrA (membrane-fusion protein)